MIVTDKYIFLTPAKTGSSSLEKFFQGKADFPKDKKHDIFVPKKYRHLKKVLLVRNPYDWFISHYYWSNTKLSLIDYANFFKRKVNSIAPYCNDPYYEESPVDISAGRLITKKEAREAIHTDPQTTKNYIAFQLQMYKPLSCCLEVIQPDYLIRLETMKVDLEKLGFTVNEIPHDNKSTNRPQQELKRFYSAELLRVIGPLLAREAKALGYPILEV